MFRLIKLLVLLLLMRRFADCDFAVVGSRSSHSREQTGTTGREFGAGHDCPSLFTVRISVDLSEVARLLRFVALAADDQMR